MVVDGYLQGATVDARTTGSVQVEGDLEMHPLMYRRDWKEGGE